MADLELVAVRLARESLTSPKAAVDGMEAAIKAAGLNEAELRLLDFALSSGRGLVARLLSEIEVKRALALQAADRARQAAKRHERALRAASGRAREAAPVPLDKLLGGLL